MATKAQLFFLLAFVLLANTMVSSAEEDVDTEHHHHRHHHHKHDHAPAKPPIHAPSKAEMYPPKKAPAYPPIAHHHSHGDCIPMCAKYCDHHTKKDCQKLCVPCCDEYKCVPGQSKTCKWEEVKHHGKMVKCPKY